MLGHLHLVAARLAEKLGVADGYRLVAQLQGAGGADGAAPAPAPARRPRLGLAAGLTRCAVTTVPA